LELLLGILKDAGAPVAAIIVQAILTWQRVRELGKRMDRVETSLYGGDDGEGLVYRVKLMQHDMEGDR
jgi:hypothetical protein